MSAIGTIAGETLQEKIVGPADGFTFQGDDICVEGATCEATSA